jgi:hypothetical protein
MGCIGLAVRGWDVPVRFTDVRAQLPTSPRCRLQNMPKCGYARFCCAPCDSAPDSCRTMPHDAQMESWCCHANGASACGCVYTLTALEAYCVPCLPLRASGTMHHRRPMAALPPKDNGYLSDPTAGALAFPGPPRDAMRAHPGPMPRHVPCRAASSPLLHCPAELTWSAGPSVVCGNCPCMRWPPALGSR